MEFLPPATYESILSKNLNYRIRRRIYGDGHTSNYWVEKYIPVRDKFVMLYPDKFLENYTETLEDAMDKIEQYHNNLN